MRMQKVCKAAADVGFPAKLEEIVKRNVDTGCVSMYEHQSALSFFKE